MGVVWGVPLPMELFCPRRCISHSKAKDNSNCSVVRSFRQRDKRGSLRTIDVYMWGHSGRANHLVKYARLCEWILVGTSAYSGHDEDTDSDCRKEVAIDFRYFLPSDAFIRYHHCSQRLELCIRRRSHYCLFIYRRRRVSLEFPGTGSPTAQNLKDIACLPC